ncbi:hypothetical protein DB347_12050 [Opitutaceae bacterium EW11]|nr:hypothetical protein DB347_12050 [Opitutaceae bacterium EW11]
MKIHHTLLFAAGLAASAVAYAGYDYKESFSQTGAFDPNGTLSLSNVNGSITVETWDKNEILIEGEKRAKTEDELKRVELKIDLTQKRADIDVHLPKRTGFGSTIRADVVFRIKIPATASIDEIHSVNASVVIEGVHGGVRAENVNGRIRAHNISGNVRLKTVNGSVDASLVKLDGKDEVAVKTVNGGIKLAVPSGASAKLEASVVNGHVDCEIPIKVQGHLSHRRISGTIGDGAGSIDASTVNGSVQISKT